MVLCLPHHVPFLLSAMCCFLIVAYVAVRHLIPPTLIYKEENHAVLETVLTTAMIKRIWLVHDASDNAKNPAGGGCPSKAIIGIVTSLLLGITGTPITANAATITTATASEQYQLYDQRTRDQQVSVNKVWDDGLTNDVRKYGNADYANLLSMIIQTGVPQTTLRTYTITYDANGGNYGTDTNGNTITTNTITYNAKNQPINGTPAAPERTDGYSLIGWSTDKNATSPDPKITLTNTVTDEWMNARTDGSTTTLYAVWKDNSIHYAVMAYGIGVDKDANGNSLGITFGPALGYPEFSPWKNGHKDSSSTQTFTRSHTVSGDATVMDESAAACTDSSHGVITGSDAGTDAAGNPYRCLHYDNWATIIYWDEHDPHVYDKCVLAHCSKTVRITPNAGTIANGTFSTSMSDSNRGLVGDGQSYIVQSQWDRSWRVDITKVGQGYAASLVRARLVGADAHTKLDDAYAGADALTEYTTDSSILSCFPRSLRDAIAAKALSGVSTADAAPSGWTSYDTVSNDGVADRLWLFSAGEMYGTSVYPSVGFSGSTGPDSVRSSKNWWWLRSSYNSNYARVVYSSGSLDSYSRVINTGAVAPGFTLP